MTVERIISGGQTGADQGGLAAAEALGIATGGWMPKGFRTEAGPRPDLHDRYGMLEHTSSQYPPRTEANVLASHATLIFGNPQSSGSKLTEMYCRMLSRPYFVQRWHPGVQVGQCETIKFRDWLGTVAALSLLGGVTLNIAGNRETSQPGIHDACRDFLVVVLRPTTGREET